MIMTSINQTISIESWKIYNSLRNKNILYQKKDIRIFYHVKFQIRWLFIDPVMQFLQLGEQYLVKF